MASARAVRVRREQPIRRVLYPITKFMHAEASGGIVLIACAALALAWANSPWAAGYAAL
jgi:Na+:H+ antiporter, NhaA family